MDPVTSLPEDVRAELIAFRDALKARLGAKVVALILYGSAARGLFQLHASDLNLLIVLSEADYDLLKTLGGLLHGTFTHSNAAPYLLTEAELAAAADAFPTRFFEMKRGYVVLAGRDVLADVQVDKAELAARCRQELLNMLMRFRHQILAQGAPEGIAPALRTFFPAFLKALRTLIYLRTAEQIGDRERLIAVGANHFGFSAAAFAQFLALRRQELDLRGPEWEEAARAFLDGLRKVAEKADG